MLSNVGRIIHGEARPPGYLRTNRIREIGTDVSASAATHPFVRLVIDTVTARRRERQCFVEPGARFAFELNRQRGAALIAKHAIALEKYVKKHRNFWVDFTRESGHDNSPKPVLVIGVDLTWGFAVVMYSHFHLPGVRILGSSPCGRSRLPFSPGTWRIGGLVHTNCGPQYRAIETVPPSDPGDAPGSTIPNKYNQCTFIRYFIIWKRCHAPARLQGSPNKNNADSDVEAHNLPSVRAMLLTTFSAHVLGEYLVRSYHRCAKWNHHKKHIQLRPFVWMVTSLTNLARVQPRESDRGSRM